MDNDVPEPKHSDESAVPPTTETNGQAGSDQAKPDISSFDAPQPYKLTPDELELLRQLWDEEDGKEAAAGLREILEGGGVSSEELFRELEKVVRHNG